MWIQAEQVVEFKQCVTFRVPYASMIIRIFWKKHQIMLSFRYKCAQGPYSRTTYDTS